MAAMQSSPSSATSPPTSRTRASRPRSSSTATPPRASASPPLAIDTTLYDAFGQRQVSTMYQELNQYHVVMEVAQKYQNDPDALRRHLRQHPPTGAQIPLSAVTHLQNRPRSARRQPPVSSRPPTTLSFNLAPNVSLSAGHRRHRQARERKIGMPATIHGSFQGTAQAFQASLSTEPILILLALFTVYIVLGILYESFIHPITILSTLPSAGVGALLALLLFKTDLSVIAMIGIILLIGIVKKNAIMMIDFALDAEREHGKIPEEAIYEACLLRFRPIMMTTMAALLGGLPLALGTRHRLRTAPAPRHHHRRRPDRQPVLTLFTTPVIYLFFDRLRYALPRWRHYILESLGIRRPSSSTGPGGPTPTPAPGD